MNSRIVLLTVSCIIFGMMLFSAVMIIKETCELQQEKLDFKELAYFVNNTELQTPESESVLEMTPNVFFRNLTPLIEENSDCIGWICIPDTQVDYPIMYTPQNPQKYLRKNFYGEYSVSGVPFLEGNSTLESDNLIIYGHNMRNGTMFSDVTKYCDEEYYTEHPFIEFETEYGLTMYDIFAVVCLKNTDDWYKFNDAQDDVQFKSAISEIKSRSLYFISTEPQYGQQLLTLSTCYGNNKSDRLVVIGAERK